MTKFHEGQRVLYRSQGNSLDAWFHAADMGHTELVMHLNVYGADGRIKPITGEIGKVLEGDSYDFYPDGWITPDSGWPRGFQTSADRLEVLEDPSLRLPGTLAYRNGKPYVTD